jgi:hypothetical protein
MQPAPLIPLATGVALIGALLAGNALLALAAPEAGPRVALSMLTGANATTLSASSGGLSGGETVTVSGEHLSAVTSVSVGGQDARILDSTNGELTFEVPNALDYTPGIVAVTLETDSGALDAALEWEYVVATAVDRQLEYAFRYWDDYNTVFFGDFNAWGGDCMNFVSQTLLARGWAPTEDWFNLAQEDWAPAFVHVPSFDEWLSSHPEYGAQRRGLGRIDDVKIGDIVVFDWDGDGSLDHAQVVSSTRVVDGETEVLMVGHNVDSTYRSIDDALEEQGTPKATVHFWSIP